MAAVKTISLFALKSQCRLQRFGFSTAAAGLLSDINVLDFTRVIAGPYCTMTLGDLGANIIKVESLDGDEARKWGPPFIKGSAESYYFLSVNRNKKSICINVKTQEGKNIFHDLARKCDVMVENFIPGKLEKMEVGYETLSKINPKLIYCAITGFGPTGPHANKPGYVLQESAEPATVITLRPTRKEHRKKVVWTEDTVDNEHMNKKKSKCCCIYEKPHKFGESDSEDSDDECEHCFGHVEKKREKLLKQVAGGATVTVDVQDSASTSASEPTATITLQQPDVEHPGPLAPSVHVQPDPGAIQPEHVSS